MQKYFLIIFFFLLINCSIPGSALLGPAFTGATTKNATQTTLSFGTNQILKNTKENLKK